MSCNKIGGKKKGGIGAADYGSYVWGKGSEQHAISSDTNTISVVNDPLKYASDSKVTGGNLTTIGVPAVLIAANQLYKPNRKTNKNRRNKFRKKMKGGGSMDDLLSQSQDMMKQSQDIMNQMKPTTLPAVVYTNNNSPPAAVPSNVAVFGGSGELKQTGAGILTDIAVPAVLLTANQMYKRKSKKNQKSRKHRYSRKVIFKRRYRR